ncbi:MAG: type II toxin-antitoxin system VapC family toxin [Opitutaceae bacterium]|jgi:PIN domain nuclease of toxin-antitoxin system|nr:type II toxin-antitoxin system VapC family toxin [Opitutaceae bacterium]
MKPGRCKYLLDTHALIWAAMDEDRLSRKAARIIATTPYSQLALADVSLQEIGLLLHLNKITVTGKPERVLGTLLNYVTVLPITLDIAIKSPALKLPHGDQFDRIITATAKVHRLTLITKDANITDSGTVPCLW